MIWIAESERKEFEMSEFLENNFDAQDSRIEKLARDILHLSRNTLVVNLRFMDKAISMLKLEILPEFNNVTVDGESIGYDPKFILRSYKEEKELPVRQYLHMVFHCIFQHFNVSTLVNQDLWNLACDIAVESAINDLQLSCVKIKWEETQNKMVSDLKKDVKYLTAEVLYRYFMDLNLSDLESRKLREAFFLDDHSIWYQRDVRISTTVSNSGSTSENQSGNDSNSVGNQSGNDSDSGGNSNDKRSQGSSTKDLSEQWKNVSGQMQTDLETFSKQRGDTAGSMMQNLNAVNREKYDYSSFLKKFAVYGEAMKINEDEFDYIFYTYGLQMYEKMPLIEPLEYKEIKRIKEFVIAIDTSGSVSGSLVQTFIQKTYNILKQQEAFFTKINLHLIQCDAEIQEAVKITSQEEFDRYLNTMKIRGLGGTDFRPVFSYVDQLIEQKEFQNLKGMIYFTDGFGVFPKKQPDYQVAVVYVNEGYENPEVPVWAMKLVLQPEEIEEI